MQQSAESKSIRAEVHKLPAGTLRRFSTSLRARIGRFAQRRVAEGASLVQVASEIEVSKQTIVRARTRSRGTSTRPCRGPSRGARSQ